MTHSPYSLDLALCNFLLVPELKIHLKKKRIEDVKDMKRNMKAQFHLIKREISEALWSMENSEKNVINIILEKLMFHSFFIFVCMNVFPYRTVKFFLSVSKTNIRPFSRSSWICQLHLCKGVRRPPPNECPRRDTKLSDSEAPVLELRVMLSNTSLSLLPGPL